MLLDWFMYYSIELANALAVNHKVLLITRDHNFEISSNDAPVSLDGFLSLTLDASIKREKLCYRRSDPRSLCEIARVKSRISKFNADVVHIQDTTDWRIIILAALCGKGNTVLTIHDVVSHMGESRGMQSVLRKRLIDLSDKVIIHGEFLRRQFTTAYPRFKGNRKIAVIPHGVLSIYKNWDDMSVEEEEATILFFGRISKYKGLDVLIEAQEIISKEIPNVKIIIAGNGNFSDYDRLITDRSYFEIHNRFISNREVSVFFRRASVVVLPYLEASQSGVVSLAYAAGKPVVVTEVGSIPEVVVDGETGFIVPPGDPVALAGALVRVLKNKEKRREMRRKIKAMADGLLAWDTIAERTVNFYSHE